MLNPCKLNIKALLIFFKNSVGIWVWLCHTALNVRNRTQREGAKQQAFDRNVLCNKGILWVLTGVLNCCWSWFKLIFPHLYRVTKGFMLMQRKSQVAWDYLTSGYRSWRFCMGWRHGIICSFLCRTKLSKTFIVPSGVLLDAWYRKRALSVGNGNEIRIKWSYLSGRPPSLFCGLRVDQKMILLE